MRLVDEYGKIHCTLEITKPRVTPRRFVSVPGLEYFAAVLAVTIPAKKD